MPRHTSFLGDNADAARVFFWCVAPKGLPRFFCLKKDMDDDFIIWYLTISTPVPQANLVSIGKDLLLVQKQVPDTVSIYIYLYFVEEASMKIPIFYLTFWIKSHPMSFPLWSNDIAKHRQTSEGFAQGAEHGEFLPKPQKFSELSETTQWEFQIFLGKWWRKICCQETTGCVSL